MNFFIRSLNIPWGLYQWAKNKESKPISPLLFFSISQYFAIFWWKFFFHLKKISELFPSIKSIASKHSHRWLSRFYHKEFGQRNFLYCLAVVLTRCRYKSNKFHSLEIFRFQATDEKLKRCLEDLRSNATKTTFYDSLRRRQKRCWNQFIFL